MRVKIVFKESKNITEALQKMTGNCELFNRSSSTRHILLEDFNLDHKEVKIDVINNTNDDNYELEKKLCKEYESKNGKKYNVVYF